MVKDVGKSGGRLWGMGVRDSRTTHMYVSINEFSIERI